MNKITLFVLAVICFEIAYSRRTFRNNFSFSDSDDDGVASPTKARRPIAKVPSRKLTKPIAKPRPVLSKNIQQPSEATKMDFDEKILYVTENIVVQGNANNGEIKVNDVVIYKDDARLKQGLVRLENKGGNLYLNGKVVLKKNPNNPNIVISRPKIDTDQVKWFKIKVLKNNGFNSNSNGSVNFSGVTINGKRINGNGDNIIGGIQYEDNVNGSMTVF